MPLIPKDFNFRWSADLSIPIKSAVFEIFPWFFLSWTVKYSFSKSSLASFSDPENVFSFNLCSFSIDEVDKISSTNLSIFFWVSSIDNIDILSTKFLNSLTLPGQLYVYKLSFLSSIFGLATPFISAYLSLK